MGSLGLCSVRATLVFAVILISNMLPHVGFAETLDQKVRTYSNLMRSTCLSGQSDIDRVTLEVDVDGNLTVSGVGANLKVTEQTISGSAEGAMNYVDEHLRSEVDQDIRGCMMDIFPQIFNAIKSNNFTCSVSLWGEFYGADDAASAEFYPPTGHVSLPDVGPGLDAEIVGTKTPRGDNHAYCRTDKRCRVQVWAQANNGHDNNTKTRQTSEWFKQGCKSVSPHGRTATCCIDPARPGD